MLPSGEIHLSVLPSFFKVWISLFKKKGRLFEAQSPSLTVDLSTIFSVPQFFLFPNQNCVGCYNLFLSSLLWLSPLLSRILWTREYLLLPPCYTPVLNTMLLYPRFSSFFGTPLPLLSCSAPLAALDPKFSSCRRFFPFQNRKRSPPCFPPSLLPVLKSLRRYSSFFSHPNLFPLVVIV